MAHLLPPTLRFDLNGLAQAIALCRATDALQFKLAQPQLDALAGYLRPEELRASQVLMAQGTTDRTVYFVETGTLSVHYEDEKSRVRMAMVGPGTVVGEGAFFAHQPRSATVQAASACKVWALSAQRFSELAHRHPAIALELVLAMGGVMAKRLYNRPSRVAVT